MPNRPSARLDIGFLLFDRCMPAGLFAVADMARAANLRAGRELFRITWASLEGKQVDVDGGVQIVPTCALGDASCQVWVVPGIWAVSQTSLTQAMSALAPVVQALRALPPSTSLWSYCTGVALLAATGRLDGRAATATWWLRGALAGRHARVRWRFDELMVEDRGLRTASGPNGYLPLMRRALEDRLAPTALRDIEDVLMLPHPREWMPVFQPVELIALDDARLRRALVFAQRCAAQELTLAVAAAHIDMSTRSRRVAAPRQAPPGQRGAIGLRRAGEGHRRSLRIRRRGQPVPGISSHGRMYAGTVSAPIRRAPSRDLSLVRVARVESARPHHPGL